MAEIKFSSEKAGRWLDRIQKRLDRLSDEDQKVYHQLRKDHSQGAKLTPVQARTLWDLERKL